MTKIQNAENGNGIYCHPVHTMESLFFKFPWETRIGLKNRLVHEIRVHVDLVSDWMEGNDF